MLKDVEIDCPACGKRTKAAVPVPEPGGRFEQRGAMTTCRACKTRLITQTFEDGTFAVAPFDNPSAATSVRLAESAADRRGPAPFALGDIMRIPPTVWQPRGRLVAQFDHRPEWTEALAAVLAKKQAAPRPLSVPPRIFISYRWGTPESDRWVARLHEELVARGNDVVFDRDVQQRPQAAVWVPELVARVADCHIFLAVLDTGYVERITPRSRNQSPEGWVWDEFQTALAFAQEGLIQILALLREDVPLPTWFRPFQPGVPGNTFDVRATGERARVVERFFTPHGIAPEPARGRRAMALLHESRQAEARGDATAANALAAEAAALIPEIPDGHLREAETAYACRRPPEALTAARRVLAIEPGSERALLLGSAAAADLQEWETCMAFARLLVERDRGNHNARFLLGRGLNARDQVEPAIAQLEVARKGLPHAPQVHGEAAAAYRRAGRPADAMKCLEDGLERDRREPLLVNYVAAAIEANQGMTAVQTLQELARRFPQSGFLAPLTEVLTRWATTEGPPPVLTKVVRPKERLGTVGCDACPAAITIASETDLLCAGCGAVRSAPHQAGAGCRLCGADGRIAPQLAAGPIRVSWVCPYCGTGSVTFG